MNINIQNKEDVIIAELSGALDVAIQADLKDELSKITEMNNDDLVLDFKRVSFIDSSCLGALVAITKKIRESGGDIKIANLNDDVRSIFQITRLDKIFDIHENIEQAVQSFYKS